MRGGGGGFHSFHVLRLVVVELSQPELQKEILLMRIM